MWSSKGGRKAWNNTTDFKESDTVCHCETFAKVISGNVWPWKNEKKNLYRVGGIVQ